MITELDPVEARVLGSLVEKSLTTREQYPLTFNSLLNACNQKTSREPVMSLDAEALGKAVRTLAEKGLLERLEVPGSRAPKFRHNIGKLLNSDDVKITAVMTVLLLRGPQTPGEIKGRTERLCDFSGTAEVEGVLNEICSRPADAMAARLPRRAGQKETRYRHLFSGLSPAEADIPPPAADRLSALEKKVEALEGMVRSLEERLPKAA